MNYFGSGVWGLGGQKGMVIGSGVMDGRHKWEIYD